MSRLAWFIWGFSVLAVGSACGNAPDRDEDTGDDSAAGAPSTGGSGADSGGAGGSTGGAANGSCSIESYDYCETRAVLTETCPNWSRDESVPREEYVETCRADAAELMRRVSPCFFRALGDCFLDGCPGDNACQGPAVMAVDPTQGDPAEMAACQDGDSEACGTWPRADLKKCVDKSKECGGDDDACLRFAVLLPEYRADADACLNAACEDWIQCRAVALGDLPE